MSLNDIKSEIKKLSREEQFQVEAYLKALRLQESAKFQAELARAAKGIESGKKITAEELEKRVLQRRSA